MDKKGLFKVGAASLSMAILFAVFVFFVIPILSSQQTLDSEIHYLGDKIRISVPEGSVKIRVTTPSTSYLTDASKSFLLEPVEIGKHSVSFGNQLFEFNVIEKPIENQTNNSETLEDGSNESTNDSVSDGKSNFEEDGISVGKPVKKTGKYVSPELREELGLKIPSRAENISVFVNGKEFRDFSTEEDFMAPIERIIYGETEKDLILRGVEGRIEVDYALPGPEKSERELSRDKKEVVVSAPDMYRYQNVKAYTLLENKIKLGNKNLIKIYWKEENKYLDFDAFDEDKDGFVDRVEWIVPHLSTQTFEVSIEVLNVQSYPVVGGNWEVRFNTVGTADLRIRAINGTIFGEDLQFLRVMCGNNEQNYEWENGDTLLVRDYNCDETGSEVSRVFTQGKHLLEFDFGGVKAYANNFASQPWWNSSYSYRRQINVSTGANTPYNNYSGYTVQLTLNTSTLVSEGKMQTDADDLRVVYYNGTDNLELDRLVFDNNTNNTLIRFSLQDNISASSLDSNYFIYYGESSVSNPPNNASNVYLWYDDASSNRESQYIQGRFDESAHGGAWADSIAWSSSGFYTFDTADNFADSFRPTGLSERDVYVEYEEFQTNAYPNDMTSGPVTRWEGTGSGATEASTHFYYYEMAASTFAGGGYNSHDDITADDRNNVIIANGALGDFPASSWTKVGIASWNVNPTNISAWYDATPFVNESGGWNSNRFSGTHAAGSDNENPGQAGIWLQQDQGNFRNLLIRRYTSPEPTLAMNTEENQTPIITDVNATNIKDSSANVVWNTNLAANSTVEYGINTSSLNLSTSNSSFSVSHSVLITGLSSNTTYFYNVTSCSEPGLCSESGTFNFTTAFLTPPDIFNISPVNGSTISTPVTLSASTNENASCQYSTNSTFVYGSGSDFTSGQNTTFHSTSLGSLADGVYDYYIKCQDLGGAANDDSTQGSTTFTVDATPPTINLDFPISGSTIADVTPLLNVTLQETVDTLWYTTNGGVTNVTICTSCNGNNQRYLHFPEGSQTVAVYANDSLGNLGTNSSSFTIDMNFSYYESFDDNSSIDSISQAVWTGENISFNSGWNPIQFQRAGGSTGTSHTIDIGQSGNNRLVAVFLDDESTPGQSFQGTVSIGSATAIQIAVSNNPTGAGNHQELHIFNESILGALSGSQTISYSGGGGTWAMHVQVFYNVNSTRVFDVQIDNTSASQAEILPSAIDIPNEGLLIFGAANGQGGTYNNADWDTNPTEGTDDGLTPEIEMTEATDGPNPNSAVLATAYWVSSTDPQTNRLFRARGSATNNLRGTGIIASFEPLDKALGNFTSKSINTTTNITQIDNVTWNEVNTDSANNLTLQISPDYGQNWYNATNGQNISDISTGNALLYRVLFNTDDNRTIYFDNLTINWSNAVIAPPNVTITAPVNGSTISDVTPALNISVDKSADTLWYTLDGGTTNTTICNNCAGTQTGYYLHLSEGSYDVTVYANDSANRLGFDNTSFTIDMNFSYYENFDDNSSLDFVNSVTWNQGNVSFTDNSPQITFQRAGGSTGTSHTIDIGQSGNNRLVAVFLDDESTPGQSFQGTVSIGSVNATQVAVSNNPTGVGNHQELHIFNESILGALSGSQTISYNGGDVGWGMHVQVFYNVKETSVFDVQIDNTSAGQAEILPAALDIPQNGLVIFGAANGQGGTYNNADWDTNPTEGTDDGLTPEIEMIESTDGPNPSSAVLATAYWVSSTDSQTNRFFRARGSNTNNIRGTGIIASFEPLDRVPGNFTSKSINTTAAVREITNITWDESNTDGLSNNINVQISADNGQNWYNATNGQNLTGFAEGNVFLYRVLFETNDSRIIYFDNLSINWSDLGLPSITITSPLNQTYSSHRTSINYTFSGSDIDSCWYTLDGGVSNTTISCGTPVTGISSQVGPNNWTIYINNTGGFIDFDKVDFTVDVDDPSVSLTTPGNNSQFSVTSISFNWTATDEVDSSLLCNVTLDGSVIASDVTSANGTLTNYTENGVSEGTHFWNVTCADDAGRSTTSETRVFGITIQTILKQIIKGSGTTSGAVTYVTLPSNLTDITKAFHFVTYNHTFVNDHDGTFKSSEILNETTLAIYSADTNNPIEFEYKIIELTSLSPTVVQRTNITVPSGATVPLYSFPFSPVNLSESFLIYQGHTHEGVDSSIGREEFNMIRLFNSTNAEYNVGLPPNSEPQYDRFEVVDWNDPGFVEEVQRGFAIMGTTQTTISVTPSSPVDPNRTLLFVNYFESSNDANTEPPSEVGILATLDSSGNINLERAASGPELNFSWQLVEFKQGLVRTQHIRGNFSAGQSRLNFTLSIPASLSRSAAFGTVSLPFGHSGGSSSDTTGGAIDSAMFSIKLENSTEVSARRGDSTGSASVGIQIFEFTGTPTISNVNATDIIDVSARITWDTDVAANSTVKYGTDTNLSFTEESGLLVTSHSITLTSLGSNTTYFYNVSSCNPNGCDEDGPFNFTTSETPSLPPEIFLINPPNNTFQNSSTAVFYYNITDINENVVNSTLVLNGQLNQSNQSTILYATINNITVDLPDGIYNWTINSTDSTGLEGTNTSVRTITIDTVVPNITLYFPVNNSSYDTSILLFNFTVTDNLDSLLVCDLIIDGSTVENNFNATNGSVTNFTESVSAGNHLWNVTCIDDAGNFGASETWNFSATDEPPTLTLVTGNNSFFNTSSVILEYNATDNLGFLESRLILNEQFNQTNQTPILNGNISNFTLALGEGFYNWTVNVTDTGGFNVTNTTRYFTVDLTAPQILLNLPPNNTQFNNSDISFNFTVTDNIDSSIACNLTVGSTQDNNFQASNGSLTNRALTNIADGEQYWNVTCIDDAGNANSSESRFINVTEYPIINLTVDNNTFFNTTSITLSYLPSDNVGFASCSLFLDGTFNQTNQTDVGNDVENFFDIPGISEGFHNWSVSCNDTFGLQNQSETRFFTVDADGLNVTLLAPPDGAQILSDTVEFSYNVTDNIDPVLDCNITVNGIVEDNSTAINAAITNKTVQFPTGGLKFWNVTCMDDSTNIDISETRNFTLAFAPNVLLSTPSNNTFQNSSTITLEYLVTDDNNNIANSTLILNGQKNQTNQTPVINEDVNNFTITLADGVYNWTVNVTDTTNLEGTNDSVRIFTIDTQTPNVTLKQPENNSLETWNNITFNFTATDNLASTISCDIYVNESLYVPGVSAQNDSDTLEYIVLPDGEYNWSVSCRDQANNTGNSDLFNLSVEAPPNVTLISPPNNNITNLSTIQFRYIAEDPIGLTSCSILLDGQVNDTNNEPDNGLESTFTISGISEGLHNWTVNCTDSDSNTFQPTERNFTVDQSPPNISLDSPLNDSGVYFGNGNIILRWTATDTFDNLLRCDLFVDGALDTNDKLVTSGVQTSESVALSEGLHNWSATCWDQNLNINSSATYFFNFTYPDFVLNSSSITLNDTSPREGDNVTINVTVFNDGGADISNFTIRTYDGDPDSGGTQIGETNLSILKLSSNKTTFYWEADLGTNEIFAIVDPPLATNGSFTEWDETNNKNSSNATTSGWHFFYGSIGSSTNYTLDDSADDVLIRWPADEFADGNIFVADLESIVSWKDLIALGRNISETTTDNDFSDIDSLLNMSSFNDSISNVYTTDGNTPKNTSNFIIFQDSVNNVPVADSINNTNFLTGILWDSSDDSGNLQFSQNDREDLVFVTKINKGAVGSFGNYDYEVRVPATLRSYYPADSSSAVFYLEVR